MPDPILGILAFLGLFAYAFIGALTCILTMRAMNGPSQFSRLFSGSDDGSGYLVAGVFWPAWLAIVVVGGAAVAIFYGPIWTAKKIYKYAGESLEERHAA